MSDKTPTAVQWLIKQLIPTISIRLSEAYMQELIDKSIEMEKQQIIEAYKSDMHPCSDEDAEQYYTDNYKP
jgi:hypothetical protein